LILTTLLLLLHDPSAEYSIRGNHPHCQLPKEQYGIVEDFIDRFLLKKGMQ